MKPKQIEYNGEIYIDLITAATRLGIAEGTVRSFQPATAKPYYYKRKKYVRESDIKELEKRQKIDKPTWLYDDYTSV